MIQDPPIYRLNPIAITNARTSLNKAGSLRKDPREGIMTIGDAATLLGMTYQKYNQIEKGSGDPKIGDILHIARIFGVDVLDFLEVIKEKKEERSHAR